MAGEQSSPIITTLLSVVNTLMSSLTNQLLH